MSERANKDDSFIQYLTQAGLRLTRQRLDLARLLFDGKHRHVTAETVYKQAQSAGIKISLATVYNGLHQFTQAGLLVQVIVSPQKLYFDTNTQHHHHFFVEDEGVLIDVPEHEVEISRLPTPQKGMNVERVDVIIRVGKQDKLNA